ncbi:Predicted ATPase [Nannocystis exedens]|uniref:histidine kinase n=1 Tax=Nannocystis exedens TaxID=54 RepID=A0A1I2EM24_9BACT|nr:serine/threonine protein kinase [Nannocystis exedens]SFE93849.1 Predicted ATPase [Nannocystis exedens]
MFQVSLHGYITVEVLHEGMKSEVRRASRASDGRLVILKVPRAEAVTHQRLAELRHEYDIAARLKLSGVVQALALEERGLPFLVFEDFGGLSLTQCFPSKVGVGSFLNIALQLTETLAAIHERGVIHKDIKPANIIINPRTGEVKLTDFAIASALATESVALAAPDRLVGTLAYMAPEQTGRVGRGIDQRADLYALGVTFFELLTGRRPFAQSDAMELVHAHLARSPPDPAVLEPSIGRELSAIVLKLMAKNVDERYRSAHALRADLEYLRQSLGGDAPSAPRPRRSAEFRLPQRLYGRAGERTRLLAAFEHAAAGERALALISGFSGTGKSALVHELHQPIVARRGNFIAGKFDQYNRHVPFASLLQTLRQLVELVLASPLGEVERWRRRLADALGAQTAVLVDTLPDLAHVVGEQPPPPPVSAAEAQNRLHLAVLRFIGVFADKDHPLVVFLDDLQWADGATLRLLGALLGDHDLRHVLVIGAYRDHEVDAYHPLRKTVAELEQAGATIERIELTPLGRADVAAIVADALAETPAAVADLAAEVHQRTEGNPLFVREFLRVIHGEELIRFSPELGRWTWDLAALRAASIPDDVADLLLERIRRLGPQVRALLTCAACIGAQFDLDTLGAAAGRSGSEIGPALWEAIGRGLVVPIDPEYRLLPYGHGGQLPNVRLRFLHDRVRQAAYTLVAADERPRIHLAIGRHLLATLASRDRSELLEAVSHLNLGRGGLGTAAERTELAALDLEAGRRAKAATAYDAAVGFLRVGAELLGPDHWHSHYRLIHALYLELAECEYLSGDFDRAEQAFDVLLAHAASGRDALAARSLRVVLYVTIGRSSHALVTGVDALRLAGLDVPEGDDALREAAARERADLQRRLAGASIAALADRPRATDPEFCSTIKLITDLLAPAQLTRQPLFEYLCLKQINLSLEHGHADASPYGYLVYAFYLTTSRGAVREAYEFGEAALVVNERLGNLDQVPRLNFVFGSILHYYRPLPEVLEYLERARYHGLETGDYIFVSYACSHSAIVQFGAGTPLRSVAAQTDEYLHLMQRTRVASSTAALRVVRRLVTCLQGETAGPTSLGGDGFDEDAFFAAAERDRLTFATLWYCIAKLYLCLLHGELDAAQRWMRAAEQRLLNSSWFLTTELAFYAALVHAALLRRGAGDRDGSRARLEELRERYALWAASCPENFAHKLALIDAERAALAGDGLAAITAYDAAIAGSHRGGAIATEALAAELAGAYHLQAGRDSMAAAALADAEAVYRRWGAAPRADALLAVHGNLFRTCLPRAVARPPLAGESLEASIVTATSVDPRLDLSSAIKAAETFAVEVDRNALLRKFMAILVENAGADRGALALASSGGLVVVASYAADQGVVLHDDLPISEADVPAGLLRVCQRSGRVLLPDDVDNNPSLLGAYLLRVRPLSLACFPLLSRGQRIGALYLENRAIWGAFTPHRLEILRLLTTQLAIAIENARMFTALDEARRSAEEASVAKSRFMLNMSHELRTPLNWIIGAAEMLHEEAADDGLDAIARDLDKISRAGRGLLGIISDVLDITQLESGRLVLAAASFPIADVVREVVEAHLPEVERNHSTLRVHVDPPPFEVVNDRGKLVQVIGSVVRNAARFTERGTIDLRVVRRGDRLVVEVADTGIGMSKQQRTKIFDAFSQVDDSPTRKVGGMGLGLAICRKLCERMGGTISVVSELGTGSTFTIDLPLVVGPTR